jgi:Domain of unknown function (DUF4115)
VLIGAVVGVVVAAAVVVAVFVRFRSTDDEHSVQHYHRRLHTLEEIRTHPSDGQDANGEVVFPASAFKVSGSSNVRLTEPGHALVPPVPPPPVPNPAEPVTFDDERHEPEESDPPERAPGTFMSGSHDKAMVGINHRPRRLGGPLLAVAAVAVVVAVLIVTGLHSNNTKNHGKTAGTATTQTTQHATGRHSTTNRHTTTTTTTTAPPAVSAPQSASTHAATYQVSSSDYSLVLAATTGECWVEATNATTGAVLFTTTLSSGQSHTIPASGSVTVIAGAPAAFSATVNGAAVTLPAGDQAPFTLHFDAPAVGSTAGSSGPTGSTGTQGSTPAT